MDYTSEIIRFIKISKDHRYDKSVVSIILFRIGSSDLYTYRSLLRSSRLGGEILRATFNFNAN